MEIPGESLFDRVLSRGVQADPDDPQTKVAVERRLEEIAANPGDTTADEFRRLIALRQKLMTTGRHAYTDTELTTLNGLIGDGGERYSLPRDRDTDREYLTSVASDVARGNVKVTDWVEGLVKERGEAFRATAQNWAKEVKRLAFL